MRKFGGARVAMTDGFSVWAQLASSLLNVRSIFSENKAVADGLKQFTLKLVSPATEKIGWEFGPKEDFVTGELRALLISTAGGAGHTAYCSMHIETL